MLQIIQPLGYAIGQKNHTGMKVVATSTNFMESRLIDAWNFPQQECTVKIDAYIVGDQWNFMIQ